MMPEEKEKQDGARPLDARLLEAVLVNRILERGMKAESLHEAGQAIINIKQRHHDSFLMRTPFVKQEENISDEELRRAIDLPSPNNLIIPQTNTHYIFLLSFGLFLVF